MDAVSFAASIVGFASLVIQLSQISVDYASKVSSASKAQAAYIQELVVLQSVLKKYEDAATIDDLKNITGNWNAPISTTVMDSYKRQLEKVKTKLEKNLTRDSSFSGLKSFTWPFQESEMARVVELLHRIRGILHSSLSADNLLLSVETFREVKIMHNDQQLASLLNWLAPSVPQMSVDSVLEVFCEGTCQALLEDDRYLDWRDGTQQLLWVSGQRQFMISSHQVPLPANSVLLTAGSGKTMLAANLIQNLTEISSGESIISYHFFRSDNVKDSIDNVFRDLLQKALPQTYQLLPLAVQYHKRFGRSVRTPTEKLWEILIATKTSVNSVYIILDGLDEFHSVNKLFPYIHRLTEAGIKVLVTSRHLPTIQSHLCDTSHQISATTIEGYAAGEDIRVYVEGRMRDDCVVDHDDIPLDIRNDILSGMVKAANGSFLLSRLAMDFICNLTSVASLRTCLVDLPSTYEKAYEKTFERVLGQPDSIVNLAKRVLNWVVHAKRPLTMLELQHAIAIKLGSKSIDPESLESSKLILASCLGMISLSKVDGRVSIIHSTARQFLVTNEQELSDRPQLNISRICLEYLAFDEFSSGPCESVASLRQRLSRMPFLDYCAWAWGHHVRQFQEVLWDELVTVLCSPPLCASAWQVLHYRRLEDEEASEEVFSLQCRNPHGLHVAAFWGFAGFITRSSWKLHETNFSPVDSHGWTPLHWAASLGNEESANGLLNHGVNINASDANSWTPLTFAVVKGHFNVVKLLLSRGADRNTQDTLKLSPERWASICSHDDILQLLRETGEPPVTDKAKIWRQQEKQTWKVSMERLDTSMDPGELDDALSQCERKVEERGTLEQEPIETDNPPEIWGTLIKMDYCHWGGDQSKVGVSISLRKRILELAILQEKLSIIKLVVQNDTRIGKDLPRGTVGRLGRTCLHTAAYGTSPSIAAFLLQSGADGSIRDEMGRIPLHLAAAYGSLEVVQVMTEAPNVDVNARDEMGRTPIHWCCALGGWKQGEKRFEENIKICRLLLSKGASLSAVDDNGYTALHYAILLRDEEVIRLCLDHGLQLAHKNKKGESPLDIFTNDTYYDSLGHSYCNVWDRPYCVQKYIWWPSKEQTMSALHVVEPYISSEMQIAPEVKKLLHEAREYSLINKS